MRVGMRDNKKSVLGRVVEMDMATKWDLRRAYEEAEEVMGVDRCSKNSGMKAIEYLYENGSYPECIMLYNNESKLRPKWFDKPDMSKFMEDSFNSETTIKPDVIELFYEDHKKLMEEFDKLLINGYIDFKEADVAILRYEYIPEHKANKCRMVVIDLND